MPSTFAWDWLIARAGRAADWCASFRPENELGKRTLSPQLPGAQALGEVRFPTPRHTPYRTGKRIGCHRPDREPYIVSAGRVRLRRSHKRNSGGNEPCV